MNENQDKARLGDRLMPVDETGTEEGLLKVELYYPATEHLEAVMKFMRVV